MIIAVPKETLAGETRVALSPETAKKFIQSGFDVWIEKGAGENAQLSDEAFEAVGVQVDKDAKNIFKKADILLKVQKPAHNKHFKHHEADLLNSHTVLIAFLQPVMNLDLVEKLASRNITSFAMELIPRISRAQNLDALSSQTNISGYKSVLVAANASGKVFPMMITAAGTIKPAKVLVLGAGVAGLQAIATAKRLGASVEAFDTRPIVKEQVESLGGKFIELILEEKEAEGSGGYAKEISKDSHEKELELIAKHAKEADIVITTALIPNKPAPVLSPEETVKQMKRGSVIVDLAAEQGGNCPLSEPDREVEKFGVKILGYTNLARSMAQESSLLYSRNVMNLVFEMTQEGKLNLDLENEVLKGSLLTHQGEVFNPSTKAELLSKGASR